jgi:protein-tyrosine phosphatase
MAVSETSWIILAARGAGRYDVPFLMIDLHCHILHGLDDGPRELEGSIALARALVADGITIAVATPHVYKGRLDVRDRELVRQRIAELAAHVPELKVLPGAEVRMVPDLLERVEAAKDFFLLGEGAALLLEIPDLILPSGLQDIVFELRQMGLNTVLAHPERNVVLRNDWNAVSDLVDGGTLLQITDRHILGSAGREIERFCRKLIEAELAFAVASDAHGDQRRMPALTAARDRLRRWFSPQQVDPLFDANPAALLAGTR